MVMTIRFIFKFFMYFILACFKYLVCFTCFSFPFVEDVCQVTPKWYICHYPQKSYAGNRRYMTNYAIKICQKKSQRDYVEQYITDFVDKFPLCFKFHFYMY
nr:MAG TPA: hypothetical protein [Caudoviricetes sp.]